MPEWILEVCLRDAAERAHFESREEAIQHAKAIMNDYDGSATAILIDPSGVPEKVAPAALNTD